MEKLRIELTKSRARHSNDNALVEYGHVVRKLLGHAHIPRRWAGPLNDFHRQHLNPYVNYHRPCLFPEIHRQEGETAQVIPTSPS